MSVNTITQEIQVALDNDWPYEQVKMKQADTGRILTIKMVANGKPAEFPAGTTANFRAKKADGTFIYKHDGVLVNEDTVTVNIDRNTLASRGTVKCDIELIGDGSVLGTALFNIDVMPAAVDQKDIQSSDDWQTLTEAAQAAEEARDQAEKSAQDAANSAEEAKKIKDSTEIEYNVQSSRVGFKRKDEDAYTYTDDLTGPPGPPGPAGDGTGDMLSQVYDPQGRETDIFQYIDNIDFGEAVAVTDLTASPEIWGFPVEAGSIKKVYGTESTIGLPDGWSHGWAGLFSYINTNGTGVLLIFSVDDEVSMSAINSKAWVHDDGSWSGWNDIGDMSRQDYDPNGTVQTAGGIPAYVGGLKLKRTPIWTGTLNAGSSITLSEDIAQYFPFIVVAVGSFYCTVTAYNDTDISVGCASMTYASSTSSMFTAGAQASYNSSTRILKLNAAHQMVHYGAGNHSAYINRPIYGIYKISISE